MRSPSCRHPVGPIIRMFFGTTSSRIASGKRCRRQRLRSAIATARLASCWPMMNRSRWKRSRAARNWGASTPASRTAVSRPASIAPSIITVSPPIASGWYRRRYRRRSSSPAARLPPHPTPRPPSARAPRRARNCRRTPIAITPSSGSSTSPWPVNVKLCSLSATAIIASSRRRNRSERQSFASSTHARSSWPGNRSSFASSRSSSVKASAVAPANPASTCPPPIRRTLRALPFTTVWPSVTWPSPAMATAPSRLTQRIVVPCQPAKSVIVLSWFMGTANGLPPCSGTSAPALRRVDTARMPGMTVTPG